MSSRAPERIETERLLLRRPRPEDAEAILARYASDPEVTRYLAWPRHEDVADSRAFVELSDSLWRRDGVGPYLIEARADGRLLGSTGLDPRSERTTNTGYVIARDAWGQGFATEALRAMVALARELGFEEVWAYCHHEHAASQRVLEKAGFRRGELAGGVCAFPNLDPPDAGAYRYALDLA